MKKLEVQRSTVERLTNQNSFEDAAGTVYNLDDLGWFELYPEMCGVIGFMGVTRKGMPFVLSLVRETKTWMLIVQ